MGLFGPHKTHFTNSQSSSVEYRLEEEIAGLGLPKKWP